MENNCNNNSELIQMIKNFTYDSKFKDLGIFSKQYLSSILYSMYEDNSDSLFSLAFGDFDGLRAVNDKYSIPVGDKAMTDSLKLIQEVLPSDTLIARAAGDEFIFLSTSLTKKKWDVLIPKVISHLKENSKDICGLNITMSALDSKIYSDFNNLYKWTESDVGFKKHKSEQKSMLSNEEILKEKILNDFRKFFNYYRLNEGTSKTIDLPNSFFNVMSDSLINIVINRFEDIDTPLNFYMECLENTMQSDETFLQYLQISKDTANSIHNVITKNKPTGNINEINSQELDNVFKFLIREPLTGEFSKGYFRNYLSDKIINGPEKIIGVQVFDLVHLKLSNDTVTHLKTDQKISELFSHILYGLHSKVDYSDFEHDSGNYLISYGGKLISIQNGGLTISEDEINEILNKSKTKQRILDIVSASKNGKSSDLNNIISELSDECVDKKHDLKINKITSKEAIVPLNIALKDSLCFYSDIHRDPYSFTCKRDLINKLWDGMCTVVKERHTNMNLPDLRVRKINEDAQNTENEKEQER